MTNSNNDKSSILAGTYIVLPVYFSIKVVEDSEIISPRLSPFQGCRITEQIRVKSPITEDIKNFKVTISIGFRAFDLGTTLIE